MTSLKEKRFVDTDYLQENVIEKLEILENVSERNNMEYSTDNGIVHCKDTIKGRVNDLAIEGNTMVNYCTDGSKTLTLNGDIDEVGTRVTTTNAVDNGLVDVVCEGETLVNVCDQKDPVAITKSYTVENTNHVPLQGEYDGKCRPVVQGQTLVNLRTSNNCDMNISDMSLCEITSTSNKISGTVHSAPSWMYLNMGSLKGNTLFKPNTKYTIVFKEAVKVTTALLMRGDGSRSYSSQAPIINNKAVITTKSNINDYVLDSMDCIYVNINNSSYPLNFSCEIVGIFEGDWTDKEVPRYFKGLKSSFEDHLIPTPIFTNIQGRTLTYGEQLNVANGSMSIENIQNNKTYTLYMEVEENTLNSTCIWELTGTYQQSRLVIPQGQKGIFVQSVTTPGTSVNNTVWISSKDYNGSTVSNPTGSIKVKNLKIFEGDYCHLKKEDFNYSGKYRVDYKVTGKNKINKPSNTSLVTDVGDKYVCSEGDTRDYVSLKIQSWGTPFESSTVRWTEYVVSNASSTGRYSKKFTKRENDRYLRFANNGLSREFSMYWDISHLKNGDYIFSFELLNLTVGALEFRNFQIEEGEVATTYEPYKESIKTFYLNSPLLEGDTIEDVNGKATHIKRYKQVVFNGSETGWVKSMSSSTNHLFYLPTSDKKNTGGLICDSFKLLNSYQVDEEGIYSGVDINLRINTNKLSSVTVEGLQQWLQANPTTIVYELASPIYEQISEESILTDSYVNGHLDLDTIVPIKNVRFIGWGTSVKYLLPNTPYTVQFNSDKIGKLYYIGINWKASQSYDVVKGVNRFTVNIGDTINSTFFELNGIGFNASNISVVATEREFDYFEGLSSVGQDDENGHNLEITSRNKNLFKASNVVLIHNTNTFDGEYFTFYHNNKGEVFNSQSVNALASGIQRNKMYTVTFEVVENTLNGSFEGQYGDTPSTSIPVNMYIGAGQTGRFSSTVKSKNDLTSLVSIRPYMLKESTEGYIKLKIQIEEGSESSTITKGLSNTKSIPLNEPLRSLPNGIKDRFIKIGQKWYIERNCALITLNGRNEDWNVALTSDEKYIRGWTTSKVGNIVKLDGTTGHKLLAKNLPYIGKDAVLQSHEGEGCGETFYRNNLDKQIQIKILTSKLSTPTRGGFVTWLQSNPQDFIIALATPVYEELTVDPTLTTYVDQTHISTNSVIPCDMKVKNTGYSTIIKPSTLYTVALDTNNSGEVKVNLGGAEKTTTNNVVTLTTPSTLVDNELRISGKGLTSTNVRLLEGDKTNFIPTYFEGLKSSFEEKQGDNHIVEVVSKNRNLFNMDNVVLRALDNNIVAFKENNQIKIKNTSNQGYGAEILKLSLEKGTYTVSGDIEDIKGSSIGFRVHANKTFSNTTRKLTFTVDYDQEVKIYYYLGMPSSTEVESVVSNIQLVKGTDLQTYVPYKSSKVEFSTLAPLRSVGDISDKLVYKDNKWMIERNCGEVILDGNKDYVGEMYKDGENYLQFNLKFDKHRLNDFVAYSDRFVNVEFTNQYNSEGFSMHRQKLIVLKILKTKLSTQDLKGLKEWLSENPTTIVYQLAEPYYEEIGEYSNLDSYDEGTTIYANTFIAPKSLSFNLATHMNNIVKDVQDDVSDLKTWRSEVFDSITHKKTFDSGFTTVEDTKEGVIDEVKLQGKTLVNLLPSDVVGVDDCNYSTQFKIPNTISDDKYYTLIPHGIQIPSGTQMSITQTADGSNPYVNNIKETNGVFKFKCKYPNFDRDNIYLRIRLLGLTLNSSVKFVILEGDHTNNPPSFFEGLMSVGEDIEEMSVESINPNLFDGKLELGAYSDLTGLPVDHSEAIRSCNYIHVKGVKQLSVVGNETTLGQYRIFNYDRNKRYLNTFLSSKTQGFEVNNNVEYIRFHNNTKGVLDLDVMVSVNRSKYVPHKSDKKSLLYFDTETQTWEKPILRQGDSIEKHSDGKYYYHKRSEQVVLNGSENWLCEEKEFHYKITNHKYTGYITSDKIPTKETNFASAPNNGYALKLGGSYGIIIRNDEISSIPNFKQWLQTNPVTVVYELAQEKVYEVANIELNSYDGETNIIVNSGAISPITTVSLTSNLPKVAENLKNRVRQLEDEVYNYKVVQNIRQLRTFYKSDYANFGISVVTNAVDLTSTEDITPYGYDLFELFKQIIEEGKDTYDRIELEEYIDFYVMTFIFNFDMAFELFDMIESQHLDSDVEEDEEEVEDSEIIEDEDFEIDVDMGVIPDDDEIDVDMGVIPDDDQIDVDMGVVPDEDIDPEMGVIPNEPSEEEDNSNLEG